MAIMQVIFGNITSVYSDESSTISWLFTHSFCWKCSFLRDCYRKNKNKDLDSPYCFQDSKMHHLFTRKYRKMCHVAVERVESEIPEWVITDE